MENLSFTNGILNAVLSLLIIILNALLIFIAFRVFLSLIGI